MEERERASPPGKVLPAVGGESLRSTLPGGRGTPLPRQVVDPCCRADVIFLFFSNKEQEDALSSHGQYDDVWHPVGAGRGEQGEASSL